MHRLLIGTCVLALAVVAAAADDKKPDDKKPDEKKSAGDTFKGMFKELVGKYRPEATRLAKEKDPKEKAKIQKGMDDLLTSYAEKFVELAEKNPKDENALGILVSTVNLPIPFTKDGPKSKALALLKKDHVKSTKLAPALRALAQSDDPASASFVKAVLDENPDPDIRTAAMKAYMGVQEQVVMANKDPKAVAAARKELDHYRKLIQTDFKGKVKDLYVGAAMPELTSKNLEDKEVKLSDLKGKVVMLDIWATWCPPCRAMIPHSKELVGKLKGKPFVLVGISVDDKKEDLTDFMKKNEMPWTHWWNGATGGLIDDWDIDHYPTIFVLDAKGVIRYKEIREKKLEEAVETLLKEMEDKKEPSKDKKDSSK